MYRRFVSKTGYIKKMYAIDDKYFSIEYLPKYLCTGYLKGWMFYTRIAELEYILYVSKKNCITENLIIYSM